MKNEALPNIEMCNVKDLIIDWDKLYAHIDDNGVKKPELLVEHLDRSVYFLKKLIEEKGIDDVLTKIISNIEFDNQKLDENCMNFIKELFVNAIYIHDMGKINPAFQYIKMKNKDIKFEDNQYTTDTKHSELSALIYVDIYLNRINDISEDEVEDVQGFLRHILFCFAYVISRHHTYLGDLQKVDFYESLKRMYDKVCEQESYISYYKNSKELKEDLNLELFNTGNRYGKWHTSYEVYILTKLLYSTVVSCDFYATYYYDTGNIPSFKYIQNIDNVIDAYKNTNIYKGIQEYKKNKNYFSSKPINAFRSEMFLEAEENLLRVDDNGKSNLEKHSIFYLEAPTGSGKANTSINLALNIIKNSPKINKIVYVFPFNTLVEQTKKSLDEIFDKNMQENFKIAVINSITPIVTEKEKDGEEDIRREDKKGYKQDLLNRQMIHYPVTLTTHVNLFNYFFGTGREINLPLVHLCNSVIIIDEIQSYKNSIWPEIIKFLYYYSNMFNMKIIIMSATLPKLDKLIKGKDSEFCELILDRKKYYENDLFKNRVKLNFELLNVARDIQVEVKNSILDKIDNVIEERNHTRILIEFINKTTAREFYNILIEKYPNKRVVELTGDDSNYYRQKIIKEINEKYKKDSKDDICKKRDFVCKDIIVVATQVIEAGVDIDMDVGFKDISLLDGEEQFLGRINRSCERKGCIAYFFNYDKAESIYRGDFRLEKDLMDIEYREYLEDKNFKNFYELCFKRLDEKKSENNENNIRRLDGEVRGLNFNEVSEKMKLIDQKNYELYLAYNLEIEEDGEIEVINGGAVWEQYKELYNDDEMEYTEKMIKLSEIAQKIAYFTYSYIDYKNKYDDKPKKYEDRIGKLFYISNGEDYMIEDEKTGCKKFDRRKYEESSGAGGIFL
ncbi:CRISPR-associated helicase Cas3' [Clostridium botulinum]|uniref:CRISPR-associated helicase Cas3' n=1 Tax=Clostridium botulinum TaxID=1491 RepID=UPI0013762740|nr:CRISPR-associated helicase Cas3' [Clostridium botulinum]MCC5417753.1 CRISPR-associated helicase Cas3' [Clostridium botulinum]NCI18788.1 CRISPR-associated helicase Cas3' [Clostridium botulinum]NCI34487.1 CRISPR-associated helicase Cas3' [Clostridium botulinum]NDI37416.1 CRISPR-associated helicase Cas3' [Clostridium botulinum]NEZ70410.1 CRISPR-associated helicase Cas3' [Clostridium botulinum]